MSDYIRKLEQLAEEENRKKEQEEEEFHDQLFASEYDSNDVDDYDDDLGILRMFGEENFKKIYGEEALKEVLKRI